MSPRNPVINRRNVPTLRQHSLAATPDAVEALKKMAAHLHVSQGSLVDLALRELTAHTPLEVARLLRSRGGLTDAEYDAVVTRVLDYTPDKTDTTSGQ
jgi:hypothetical protein